MEVSFVLPRPHDVVLGIIGAYCGFWIVVILGIAVDRAKQLFKKFFQ
ncbi:MAG: hypothetical protein WD273_12260 [Trueperaceae bacterium]